MNQVIQPDTSQDAPSSSSRSLRDEPSDDFYHPLAGPLAEKLVRGVSGELSTLPSGGAVQKIVQLLIWIPIWLVILLLSPVDAFCTARNISRTYHK
jgi:hypothetical protein